MVRTNMQAGIEQVNVDDLRRDSLNRALLLLYFLVCMQCVHLSLRSLPTQHVLDEEFSRLQPINDSIRQHCERTSGSERALRTL